MFIQPAKVVLFEKICKRFVDGIASLGVRKEFLGIVDGGVGDLTA